MTSSSASSQSLHNHLTALPAHNIQSTLDCIHISAPITYWRGLTRKRSRIDIMGAVIGAIALSTYYSGRSRAVRMRRCRAVRIGGSGRLHIDGSTYVDSFPHPPLELTSTFRDTYLGLTYNLSAQNCDQCFAMFCLLGLVSTMRARTNEFYRTVSTVNCLVCCLHNYLPPLRHDLDVEVEPMRDPLRPC